MCSDDGFEVVLVVCRNGCVVNVVMFIYCWRKMIIAFDAFDLCAQIDLCARVVLCARAVSGAWDS